MNDFSLVINGRSVPGEFSMEVVNPATGKAFTECSRASLEQLKNAVAAAKAASRTWATIPTADRRAAVLTMADIMERNKEDLARLLTAEQGKPIAAALGEMDETIANYRALAAFDLSAEIIPDDSGRDIRLHRRPLGVVGLITPWNFPMANLSFKLPFALLCGNTVIVKPAPTTPLTTLHFGQLVKEVVPPGVLNVITDQNDLGEQLVAHPDVSKIALTGSTETGKKVMAAAAPTLKRVTLELGGNDAAIVLGDVEPEEVAPKLFESAFANSGQVCIAIKRLYVQDSIYDAVCDALDALARAAVVGDGMAAGTQFGPVQNQAHFDRLTKLIEETRCHGDVRPGSEIPASSGFFVAPTIVRNIKEGTRLVDEEQFGPVLPVISFQQDEDIAQRVNASRYGLGASVWSGDVNRAREIAERLECGTIWINKHLDLAPHIPFGGVKQSGIGVEMGTDGLREYTRLSVIND